MRIGPRYSAVCKLLSLCGSELQYVSNVKYRSVFLVTDKNSNVLSTIDHLRLKFLMAFKSLYSRIKAAKTELVTV